MMPLARGGKPVVCPRIGRGSRCGRSALLIVLERFRARVNPSRG